jgi:DNA-binding transcriptional MerR regulator
VADPLIDIPDRPAFKAAEVCEIAQIPPYVLRSWEKEFPNLGVVPRAGAARVYRRGDVEHILKIKQLVFSEGLTLSGARRRLEGEPPPEPEPELPIPEDVKARVGKVKQELRSLLQLLGPGPARPPVTEATPHRGRLLKPVSALPDDEPALPLLDAEAETTMPPPAAAVPAGTGTRRRRKA